MESARARTNIIWTKGSLYKNLKPDATEYIHGIM